MKNTIKNIIRYFLLSNFALLLFATFAFTAPIVGTASSVDKTDLWVPTSLFRQDLGTIRPYGDSYITGRREIDWEDHTSVQGYNTAIRFPYDYYNKIHPRGIVFNTPSNSDNFNPTMIISHPHPSYPNSEHVIFSTPY